MSNGDASVFFAVQAVLLVLQAGVSGGSSGIPDIGVLVCEQTKYIAIANFVVAAVAILGYLVFILRFFAWGPPE